MSGFIFLRSLVDLRNSDTAVRQYAITSECCHSSAILGDIDIVCPLMPSYVVRSFF